MTMNNLLVTIFLTVTLSVYAQAGGIQLKEHFDSKKGEGQGHWSAPEKAMKRKNPIPGNTDSINRGRDLYRSNCLSCHGENAEGDGHAADLITPKPANLRKMSGLHSDGYFAWKIENGRGPMPAWENILTKNQIWDLVNYIQSLSGSNAVQHNGPH
jgi:mono/diheme cytochrome c family protein